MSSTKSYSYPSCTDDELKHIKLFHVTEASNLASIFAPRSVGLESQISDLTAQVYAESHPELDSDHVWEEIESKFGHMVFATTFDHLLEANKYQYSESERAVVLGIKPPCDAYFRNEEVNAPFDWISNNDIPPRCLCVWGNIKHGKKN